MKKLLALVIVFTITFVLSACGGPKELQMLWWNDGEEGVAMQALLDRYEEETGVIIELVVLPYGDYESRLRTMINGGEAPALARVTEGHLNNFKEFTLSLDGAYDQSGFTNHFYNDDDESISLPLDITANGLFVNLDILNANNINYPELGDPVWTWTEFITEMNKLKGVDGVTAPGLFDHQAHRFMPLMYQHGTTLWNQPYTSSKLTSSQAVSALTLLETLYTDGIIEGFSTVQSANAAQLFRTGNYGFHMSGNWNVSGYQDLDFNWTVIPMPKEANRATILGGKSMTAFKDSGMEKEALDFIEWLASPTQHDEFTGAVPYLTPRLGATVDYGIFSDEYAVFLDEIAATDEQYVQDWLTQVMIPGMYPIINKLVEDVANPARTKTILQLLQDLEVELKGIMD